MEQNAEGLTFLLAKASDKEEILTMYRQAIGSPGCTWSMDYPNEELLHCDMERAALFVLKNQTGELIGAISIDQDDAVEQLNCWSKELKPGAELARLVVKEKWQNHGIARLLLTFAMEELKKRNYKSVHFLVSKTHEKALRSYARLEFDKAGETDLFGTDWWCYEKAL